jgi:hypothetical protein
MKKFLVATALVLTIVLVANILLETNVVNAQNAPGWVLTLQVRRALTVLGTYTHRNVAQNPNLINAMNRDYVARFRVDSAGNMYNAAVDTVGGALVVNGGATIKNPSTSSSIATLNSAYGTTRLVLDTLVVRDTAAFATSATRLAVYYPGVRPTDYIIACERVQAELLPVAGNLLSVWPKWDSVVVFRAIGTTSGQKITFWRVK